MGECICKTAHLNQTDNEISKDKIINYDASLMTFPTETDIHYSRSYNSNGTKTERKIREGVKEKESMELSRYVFNQLNEIRFEPMNYIDIAKQYGMETVMKKANCALEKKEVIRWSESKEEILSSEVDKEIAVGLIGKGKYESIVMRYDIRRVCDKEKIIWEFLGSLSVKQQMEIMMGNHEHCVITVSEYVCYDENRNNKKKKIKDNDNRRGIKVMVVLLNKKLSENH